MSTCGNLDQSTQQALLAASLSEAQAVAIYAQGQEAVVFALLTLTKQLAESQGKSLTPPGLIPTYEKPPARRGRKRPGAKPGHPGSRRQRPARIDWQADHRAENCPECGLTTITPSDRFDRR